MEKAHETNYNDETARSAKKTLESDHLQGLALQKLNCFEPWTRARYLIGRFDKGCVRVFRQR
jgi:hypothetical protein